MNIEKLNEKFKDNILICSKKEKELIINSSFENNKIINFKILTKKEAETFFGSYVNPICKYLIFKETTNYNLSEEIYKNLQYINNKEYKNKKLKNIKYFYDNFKEEGFIKPKNINTNKKIYSTIKALDYINEDIIYLKDEFKLNNATLIVNEFEDLEEEVTFVLNKVSSLIDLDIPINKIKLYAPNQYHNIIKTMSKFYKLDFDISSSYKIISNKYVKSIVENLNEIDLLNIEKNSLFLKLNDELKLKITDIINNNVLYLDKEYIKKEIENTTINTISLNNCLQINKILDFEEGDYYNFILAYDDKNFLKYKKNDSFLNDKELNELNLSSSIEENLLNEDKLRKTMNYLKTTDYFISYSKRVQGIDLEYNKLIENVEIKKVNSLEGDRYSKSVDYYNLKKEESKLIKYNIKTPNYINLNDNLPKNKISFQMEALNWDNLSFKNSKKISSTMLEAFFKCEFMFYIKYVLKLNKRSKNTLNLHIGSYIHDMLEDLLLKDEIQIEKASENILKERLYFEDLNIFKKKFLIMKLNDFIKLLLVNIKEQINLEDFKVKSLEEEIDINIKDYILTGKIDKVLEDDNNNYMVIDYKTGDSKLDFSHINLGINMQNLIYFLLLNGKYEEVNFAGTYRYKISPKIDKDVFDPKREGYTNDKIDVLSKIEISNYKNLKFNKDNELNKSSKTLNDLEFEESIEIIKKKIEEFILKLEKNDTFKINPLKDNKNIDSCKYCDYNSICFKSKKDYKNI